MAQGNTLILEGGKGSNRINDTAVHTGLSVGQIVVLEDTEFDQAFVSTIQEDGTFSAGVNVVGTTDDPGLGAGHRAGEYISLIAGEQKFTRIKLASGSIRTYNFE